MQSYTTRFDTTTAGSSSYDGPFCIMPTSQGQLDILGTVDVRRTK